MLFVIHSYIALLLNIIKFNLVEFVFTLRVEVF